jgi:predicted transcriptional regulator
MTSIELTDDEKRELARKRLQELYKNPCSEDIIDGSLSQEQEEWVKRKLPNDPIIIENSDPEITDNEWYTKFVEKYDNLRNTVTESFPSLWDSLEFELSIQKILNIQKCTLPFAGIVLGRPSSFKTVGIELFRKWINVFYTDSFSAKAFVSHNTGVKKKELENIDLLPKIKNKLFLTPELSPTFAKKDEDLIEILGIMTRVLDGQGYESDTGAHGHRGYTGTFMFVWVGAAVDIPYKVHKYLATLGPKLYFLRLGHSDKSEDTCLEELNADNFETKMITVKESLYDYLDWFEKCPYGIKEENLVKVVWDNSRNNQSTLRMIIRLAKLLGRLRGTVPTWHSEDSQGMDYAYSMATIEEPDRAITQLRNLARGHALSQGRNYITMEDISIVIRVVLSTASKERVRIFELLIAHKGSLTTSQVADSLNIAPVTARRTMAEFKGLGLVDVNTVPSEHGEPEYQITLVDEFDWFLTDTFTELKESYRKKKYPLLDRTSTIQNCIVNNERGGGIFSYGINNAVYSQQVLLSAVIPRSIL